MTSSYRIPNPQPAAASLADGVAEPPRLVLRDAGAASDTWDGGWWPRSRLLLDELPGLIAALVGRYGPIRRVSYGLDFWADTPHRLVLDGRRVRLAGSRTMNQYSLSLTGGLGVGGVDLLVVAPEADLALATRALHLAAVAGGPPGVPGLETATPPERAWENEGGSTAR